MIGITEIEQIIVTFYNGDFPNKLAVIKALVNKENVHKIWPLGEVLRDVEAIKFFIEKCGADVHYDNDWVLREAAAKGYLESVKFLIEKCGADVHAMRDLALLFAIQNNHFEVIKYLIEKAGANVHSLNNNPLRVASQMGYLLIVKYLIEEAGADVHATDEYTLRVAADQGHAQVVDYLNMVMSKSKIVDNYVPVITKVLEVLEGTNYKFEVEGNKVTITFA